MPNANARKGAAWERTLLDFFRTYFGRMKVVRPHQEGYKDVGDIHIDPVVIQAKDVAALDVSGWLRDVETQRVNAGGRWGVVAWKRRGKGTKDGVVFMTAQTFAEILVEARRGVVGSSHDVPPPTYLEN